MTIFTIIKDLRVATKLYTKKKKGFESFSRKHLSIRSNLDYIFHILDLSNIENIKHTYIFNLWLGSS